jgi:phosphoglucomutase
VSVHELAGKPAPISILANIPRLISAYYTRQQECSNAEIENQCQMTNNSDIE